MKQQPDWLTNTWAPTLGVLFGGTFAVIVGCMVLFPAIGLLRCTILWIVTGVVVIASWLVRRFDTEAESRVVSDPLQVERLDEPCARKLSRDLIVMGLTDDGDDRITVCKDFPTNYSSIPAPCRPLVHWSKVDVAGVVHDHLYKEQKLSRADDDHLWWLLARSGKWRADPIQAWLGWLALRGFGWTHRPGARQFNLFWFLVTLLFGTSVAVWICKLVWCVVEHCAT